MTVLFNRQDGKCKWCHLYFRDGDVIEIGHFVTPTFRGGLRSSCSGMLRNRFLTISNLKVLHGHCHDRKSSLDILTTNLRT